MYMDFKKNLTEKGGNPRERGGTKLQLEKDLTTQLIKKKGKKSILGSKLNCQSKFFYTKMAEV
jgi:hypothetical protein